MITQAAPCASSTKSPFTQRDALLARSLVGDTVSSSGSWFVPGFCEVDGAGGVEGFLRGADGQAGA
jgi:hypothetical protein